MTSAPVASNPISDLAYIVQVVRDDHHGQAMVLEPSDELEDHRRLCNTEGCGWLVEHDQLRVPHDRLGDGNSLALAPGERGDGLPDRANRGHPQTCQGVRGCPLHAV